MATGKNSVMEMRKSKNDQDYTEWDTGNETERRKDEGKFKTTERNQEVDTR